MKSRLSRIVSLTLIVMLVVTALCPASLASFAAKTNSSRAKIYKSASTSSKHVSLKLGTRVTVLSGGTSWSRVRISGKIGYIPTKYLNRTSGVTGYAKKTTKVYNQSHSKSVTISRGTKLSVIGIDGSYLRVARGKVHGYVLRSAVQKSRPSGTSSGGSFTGSSKVSKLINGAKSLRGRPYKYGASGPSAFDCSGFARYCFGKVGYSLKSSAQTQGYDSRFPKVSYSKLKKGDLVFFNTEKDKDKCDHVGIYLGSGKFIHCSSSKHGVIVSSFTSYWRTHFSWGRRVIR